MADLAIELHGLRRVFRDVVAVDHLDLDVQEGEILGFVGPNGAGKTTSIRMIAGLLRPTAGEIHVFGEPVQAHKPSTRRRVGVCPQQNVLFPELSVRENLEYAGLLYKVPRRQRREQAAKLEAAMGLAGKTGALARDLSGGMQRRLTIAMALVHDPPLVILDEPEAGLDPQSRLAVREFIRHLKQDKTVLLTSHNLDEVERLADRVAFVDHGKRIALGTPDQLKASLGDGDAVEIIVAPGEATTVARIFQAPGASQASLSVATADDATVILRGRGLAKRFPHILQAIQSHGVHLHDIRYRSGSLEDVFISLTGRGLRE